MLAVASDLVRDSKALRVLRDQARESVVDPELRVHFLHCDACSFIIAAKFRISDLSSAIVVSCS
jgi:hypothetical protein